MIWASQRLAPWLSALVLLVQCAPSDQRDAPCPLPAEPHADEAAVPSRSCRSSFANRSADGPSELEAGRSAALIEATVGHRRGDRRANRVDFTHGRTWSVAHDRWPTLTRPALAFPHLLYSHSEPTVGSARAADVQQLRGLRGGQVIRAWVAEMPSDRAVYHLAALGRRSVVPEADMEEAVVAVDRLAARYRQCLGPLVDRAMSCGQDVVGALLHALEQESRSSVQSSVEGPLATEDDVRGANQRLRALMEEVAHADPATLVGVMAHPLVAEWDAPMTFTSWAGRLQPPSGDSDRDYYRATTVSAIDSVLSRATGMPGCITVTGYGPEAAASCAALWMLRLESCSASDAQ